MNVVPATPLPPASRPARLRRAGLSLALLALLGLPLAACSSSGSPSDPSSSASASAPAAGSSSGSSQSGQAAFAQCVRSHGVPDFPDPQNGHFILSGADQSNPNFQSAVQTCEHLLGPGGISGGGSNSSALLSFAHCMQTHGVPQFPDPSADGALDVPASVQNDPQFQKAQQECKSDLPGGQGQQS